MPDREDDPADEEFQRGGASVPKIRKIETIVKIIEQAK